MPDATHSPREVRGNSSGRLAAVRGRHRDASPPNNLPLQLCSFVGREKELAEVGRSPYLRAYYLRIKARRGTKDARTATARKLAEMAWSVCTEHRDYEER